MVIHWIENKEKIFKIIYESLKKGGKIAIQQATEKCYEKLHIITKKAIENLGFTDFYKHWNEPIYYSKKEEIEVLLKKIGYTNIISPHD